MRRCRFGSGRSQRLQGRPAGVRQVACQGDRRQCLVDLVQEGLDVPVLLPDGLGPRCRIADADALVTRLGVTERVVLRHVVEGHGLLSVVVVHLATLPGAPRLRRQRSHETRLAHRPPTGSVGPPRDARGSVGPARSAGAGDRPSNAGPPARLAVDAAGTGAMALGAVVLASGRTAWRHRRSSFRPWGIAQAVRGEFVETLDIRGHRYLPTGATGPARTRRARTQAGPQLERVDRAHAGAARHPCSSRSCRDERAPRNGGACGPARPPAAARRGPRGGRAVAVTGARRPARRGAPLPESHRPVVGAAADHRGEPAWAEGPGRAGRGTVDAFSSSSTVVGGPLAFAGDQLQERPLLWSRAFANAVSLEEALIDKGGERRSPTGPFVTPGRNLLSPKDRIELEGHACGAAGRGTLPRRAHRPATLHRLRAPAPDGAESAVDNPLPIR